MAELAVVQDCRKREIQVSGLENFPGNLWRQAVLYYLFGVWAEDKKVIYRPKISFAVWTDVPCEDFRLDYLAVVLRLDCESQEYFAYWQGRMPLATGHPMFRDDKVLVVGQQQVEVEQGLIRFAKNDRIRMLTIVFPNHKCLHLWKGVSRGQLEFAGNIHHQFTR